MPVDGLTDSEHREIEQQIRLASGNEKRALSAYENILEIDPRNLVALNNRADWRVRSGRSAEAIADLEWLCANAPVDLGYPHRNLDHPHRNLDHPHLNLANALGEVGPTDRAYAAYSSLAEQQLGVFVVGNNREAEMVAEIARWTSAIDAQPNDVHALFRRAAVFFCLDQFEMASSDIDRALGVRPNEWLLLVAKATMLYNTGQYEKAISYCDQADTARPRTVVPPLLRALSLSQLRQFDASLADYDRAIEAMQPHRVTSYARFNLFVDRAYARYMADDKVGALADLYRAEDATALTVRFCGFDIHEGVPLADRLDWWQERLDVHPDDPVAAYVMANLLIDDQRRVRAEQWFESVIGIVPCNDHALMRRGICRLVKGVNGGSVSNLEQAAVDLRAFLEFRPDHAYAHWRLGHALDEMAQHEQALVHKQLAAELNPWSPDMAYGLGFTLAKLDRHEEAIGEFTRAIYLMYCGFPTEVSIAECSVPRARSAAALDRLDWAAEDAELALVLDRDYALTRSAWWHETVEELLRTGYLDKHGDRTPDLTNEVMAWYEDAESSSEVVRTQCPSCSGTGTYMTGSQAYGAAGERNRSSRACSRCGGRGYIDE